MRELACSFCFKTQKEVRVLVAGSTAHICGECVELAASCVLDWRRQKEIERDDLDWKWVIARWKELKWES